MKSSVPVVLSIAASDNMGGAGVQADIKTCCALGCYSATVVTAITAQNPDGLKNIKYVGDQLIEQQLTCTYEYLTPDAIKIGVIHSIEGIKIIGSFLRKKAAGNIVLDPVLSATSGGDFHEDISLERYISVLKKEIFPLTRILTPNIPELYLLSGLNQENFTIEDCINKLKNETKVDRVLVKGGHSKGKESADILYSGAGDKLVYSSSRIDTCHTHGTGCVLSSAIACGLAKGLEIEVAVKEAKTFVDEAIRKGKDYPVMDKYGPVHPCLFY